MKKLILSFAILLTVFSTAFANIPEAHNQNAVASFRKDFKTASEVKWSETTHYFRACFMLNNKIQYAYYDVQGNLVGLVQHVLSTTMPQDLQKQIKKEYAGYWVTELFQVSFEDGTNYYIQLKNADETIVLTSDGSDQWHVYSKNKNCQENL
jgi:hypothetical protein